MSTLQGRRSEGQPNAGLKITQESTFSTVRLRTRVTRGAGSRKAALAMAYKLLDAAQARWHKIAAPEHVPLVRAGATFIDGKLQERRSTETEPDATETGSVAA